VAQGPRRHRADFRPTKWPTYSVPAPPTSTAKGSSATLTDQVHGVRATANLGAPSRSAAGRWPSRCRFPPARAGWVRRFRHLSRTDSRGCRSWCRSTARPDQRWLPVGSISFGSVPDTLLARIVIPMALLGGGCAVRRKNRRSLSAVSPPIAQNPLFGKISVMDDYILSQLTSWCIRDGAQPAVLRTASCSCRHPV